MNERADTSAAETSDQPAPARGARKWVYVAITSLVIPALFFGLLEGGLRLAGYGYPTGFLVKSGEFYESNTRFGWRFFPRDISRTPLPMHLRAEKPAGTYRIVVVGGSAAQGYPDPAFSFSRYLEIMLRDRYPELRFEVANAAMTAANSHMMVPAARDCVKLKPDLLIVYMGNNEVVGPYGPGTVFAGPSPSLPAIRMGLWIKSTRVGQLLSNTLGASAGRKEASEWRGMAMFLENLVPADDPRLPKTYSHFRDNLEDICRAGLDAGAGVVVCTVPVNLRQCGPFASGHREGLSADDLARWQAAYDRGAALEDAGTYELAVAEFTEALAIDDRSAALHFRLGRCYVALGRPDEALAQFELARELDALRFRADATINDMILQVARASDGQIGFVDAVAAFSRAPGVVAQSPGEELFFDHVHPSYRGNYELARAFFPEVVKQLPADGVAEAPSFERCNELLALTHSDRVRNAGSLWSLMRGAPFTNQLNYVATRERLLARREALWATPVSAMDAANACEAACAAAPEDATLRILAATAQASCGNYGVAMAHLTQAKQLLPNEPQIYIVEARVHVERRDPLTAEQSVARYLELLDHSLPGYIAAVNLFGSGGEPDRAKRYAREAADRMPEKAAALSLLARATTSSTFTSQTEQAAAMARARELLVRAIELEPEYVNARVQLGEIQLATGQVADAAASFARAIELDPVMPGAHAGLGMTLFRRGKLAEAMASLATAVDPSPVDMAVGMQYAEMLSLGGDVQGAEQVLRRLLRIQPGLAPAAGRLAWLLATTTDPDVRDGTEAARLARLAMARGGRRVGPLVAMAAAHAANGDFSAATRVAAAAQVEARRVGDMGMVDRLSDQLARYASDEALELETYDRLEGW